MCIRDRSTWGSYSQQIASSIQRGSLKITNIPLREGFNNEHCCVCDGDCLRMKLRQNKKVSAFVFDVLQIIVNELMVRGPLISSEDGCIIIRNVLKLVEDASRHEKEEDHTEELLTMEEFLEVKLLLAHIDITIRFSGSEKKFKYAL
eukprot:TRINITY_DN11625_c0_g1_i1.p1 TRINITY_DN11625_c0_g1~~TRINITY_DN11625_c0_g1_i1.p1  ORF type:complete len:167 (-),score=32.15 TRINITY_DN11625_c0_g1_i1:227-667(-)